MEDCNKNNSPGASNTDSLIEKFRFEITKQSDEDLLNIQKLTIQASNKSRDSSLSNRDIDKKISDLECLIKRLQEELNDLSSANKQNDECKQEDECEVDYCCPVVNECNEPPMCPENTVTCIQDKVDDNNCGTEEDDPCNKIDQNMLQKDNTPKSSNQRFPIVLRDIGHVQEQDNTYEDENLFNKTGLISTEQSVEDNDEENIPNIRDNMFYDWKKDKHEAEEQNKTNDDTESITCMIAELRAEIDETIHNLNDIN